MNEVSKMSRIKAKRGPKIKDHKAYAKRKLRQLLKGHAGAWIVTFSDGTTIQTGYYPNARMAVGEALAQHKGDIIKVTYV
jgi:hypothetical protein